MEFDELLITTGVDALVRLVKERQRIELEETTSILNIPQETIEEWARVLEEEGIIRLEYRLTKVYLLWVKPTEEEVAAEKESFYEEKTGIETEVAQFKQNIDMQTSDLRDLQKSFNDFYSKFYSKIETLEKMVAPLPTSKSISEEVLSKHQNELADMGNQVNDVKYALDQIRKEIGSLETRKSGQSSADIIDRVDRLGSELVSLQQEMEILRKKSAQETPTEVSLPTVKDIKKKFETIQREFTSLRARNAQMRQDMISLHESSEILKSVAESIMGQEDKLSSLRAEVLAISDDAERLVERVNTTATKVRQNVELIERLGDSVDVAKAVLKKFPSQDKVMQDLEKLRLEENSFAEKSDGIVKLLEAVGGKQVTAKQFSEIAKRMDEKAEQTRKDMDALEIALQDEKNTYLTFQKIKERIVPAMDSYRQQLDAMEQKIANIRQDSAAQMRDIRTEAQKLQESLGKGGQTQDILKVAGEIRDKKKMLDDIRSSLEELVTVSDNLNKRVTLLSHEAKLLEIRMGGAGAGGGPSGEGRDGGDGDNKASAKENEIRQKIELSKEEEAEFRRKREELKKLIQKLWD